MENPGKRGRPRGFDKEKYWRVLYALFDGPKCFNEVVTRSGLSRRFVWKVLKHALMRDFVGVNYSGHKALYFLKCEAIVEPPAELVINGTREEARVIEEPPLLFHEWWNLGHPHHDEFHEFLADEGAVMEDFAKVRFANFLYTQYPHLRISDLSLWVNEAALPSKLAGERVTFKKLYETSFSDILKRKKILLEDLVLTRVVNAFFEKRVCPRCFRKGELSLLKLYDEYYVCKKCGTSFKHPWKNSKIYDEFSKWCEQRDVIKLGRIKLLM
ncbi:MAG: hypothetical protein QXO15_08940 [Nitrososphaerota archaeon]